VLWWVGLYTRAAPADAAAGRYAEVQSDLHEQATTALADGVPRAQLNREIVGRVVRGVPADLAWRLDSELAPGRLRWHLQHPTTVHTLALLVLVPLALTADRMREHVDRWTAAGAVGLAAVVGCAGVVGFSMVSFAHLRPGSTGWTSGRAVRAFLVGAMSFCWALSGVWRFVPTPLAEVSTVAWVGFGAALLAYLVARAAQLTCRIARLDVRKISS
jgi:hypothetical protein